MFTKCKVYLGVSGRRYKLAVGFFGLRANVHHLVVAVRLVVHRQSTVNNVQYILPQLRYGVMHQYMVEILIEI